MQRSGRAGLAVLAATVILAMVWWLTGVSAEPPPAPVPHPGATAPPSTPEGDLEPRPPVVSVATSTEEKVGAIAALPFGEPDLARPAAGDPDGDLSVEVRPPFLGCGGTLGLELLDDAGRVTAVSGATIPADLAPGPRVRQDVRFVRPPVLARGDVVDEDGRPVPRALVAVASFSQTRPFVLAPRTSLEQPDVLTEADGSFHLFGREGFHVQILSVSRPGFEPQAVTATSPYLPVRIVLRHPR